MTLKLVKTFGSPMPEKPHHPGCNHSKRCTLAIGYGSSAKVARLKGWKVGDVLRGDEGYGSGPLDIVITAIGERDILARRVDGQDGHTSEGLWTFSSRCWKKVGFMKSVARRLNRR